MSTQQYLLHQENEAPEPGTSWLRYITRSQYSEEWNSALHAHGCTELFFITRGHGFLQVNSTSIPVNADDFLVVNSGVPHTEKSDPEGRMEYIVLGVEGLEVSSDPDGYVLLHQFSKRPHVSECLTMLLEEADAAAPEYETVCKHLLQILLTLLLRREAISLRPTLERAKSNRECNLVRRYIDEHYKENLTLDQLADMANLSKYYLSHTFQKEYGLSPMRYLTLRRIRESRFLLTETDHSLTEIARMLGFSSLSYFSQSFTRIEGTNPLEYRRVSRLQ